MSCVRESPTTKAGAASSLWMWSSVRTFLIASGFAVPVSQNFHHALRGYQGSLAVFLYFQHRTHFFTQETIAKVVELGRVRVIMCGER